MLPAFVDAAACSVFSSSDLPVEKVAVNGDKEFGYIASYFYFI